MRICTSCGRRAGEVPIVRLPESVSPDLGICVTCKDKLMRRGVSKRGVSNEADRILAHHREAFTPYLPQPSCRHCGEPVVYQADGKQPLWCHACELRRLKIATGVR